MLMTVIAIVTIAILFVPFAFWMKNKRSQREMDQHSITAEQLHALLASKQQVLLFDVRQPLDLLAYPGETPIV